MILVFVFQQQSGDVNTWATRLAAIEIVVNEPAGEAAGATDLKFKKSDFTPSHFFPFSRADYLGKYCSLAQLCRSTKRKQTQGGN